MSTQHDPSNEAQHTAERVFQRNRRRIRALAALAIGLWVLGFLLIASVYLPLGAKLKVYARMLNEQNPGAADTLLSDRAKPMQPPTTQNIPAALDEVRHQHWIVAQIVFHEWIIGAFILVMALGTGFLASVTTVGLALTIRRVTLGQVNESLTQISNQLREIQKHSF
jgi:hypothetical protein